MRPTSFSSWMSVAVKERSSALSYGLFANSNANRPTARLFAGSDLSTAGTSQLAVNTWTHLAMTWDTGTLRLYVNGTQVSSRSAASSLTTGTGPLRFGGDSFANEWFAGQIDELRLYHRALSASEINADRNRAVP